MTPSSRGIRPSTRPGAVQIEVRRTILRVIADHLRRDDSTKGPSWSQLAFDLTGATLPEIDFTNTTLPIRLSFVRTTFSGEVVFDGATFSGEVVFVGATFSGDAGFVGATFSGDAGFDGATFSGDAWSAGATFSGDAWFDGATFSGNAQFVRVEVAVGSEVSFSAESVSHGKLIIAFPKLAGPEQILLDGKPLADWGMTPPQAH